MSVDFSKYPEYGEFKCPECKKTFFSKKTLVSHYGGAHRRNISKDEKPKCKMCKERLIPKRNWAEWAIKQGNMICTRCKNLQNKKSYQKRKLKK